MTSTSHPAISAHRGGGETAPTDTWAAYEAAVSTGAEYVEFDVRRTGDGQLVCFHDEHAMPGGPALASLTVPELRDLSGHDVPLVSDVMKLIAGHAIGHVDVKDIGHEREVVDLAMDVLGADGFVATTLEDVSVRAIKDYAPQVRTALSIGRNLAGYSPGRWVRIRRSELRPVPRIRACGADWAALNHRIARLGALESCHRNGIGVMIWTVNDDALIRRFLNDARVSVLTTDRPRRAVALRDS
jgi:glycerophosphoryl diester phosphodiesterase